MKKEQLFAITLQMINELKQEIKNSYIIDCGPRLELVERCIYISFDHGIGVSGLLSMGLPIQAMIVFRAQFEAVVRAYWLLYIANNDQILSLNFSYTFEEQFEKDNYPMISEMLKKLSSVDLPAKPIVDFLCDFKKYHLTQLNSLVHTGKQSFTRDVMGFNEEMLNTLMRQSNNLITAASQIMLKHTIPNNQKYIHVLTEKYRDCFYLDEDVDPIVKARVEKYYSDGILK